jgi:cysteine desulfurase/selenocysteine lyase
MEHSEFLPPPMRFEAGTQPVSQVVALGAAVSLLSSVGMSRIAAHEDMLVSRLVAGVSSMPGVRLLGSADPSKRVALVAIDIEGVHAHDAGQYLDDQGISVRVGHHCTQPLHRALGITASVRASVHLTTTVEEVDRFLVAVRGAQKYFGVLPGSASAA